MEEKQDVFTSVSRSAGHQPLERLARIEASQIYIMESIKELKAFNIRIILGVVSIGVPIIVGLVGYLGTRLLENIP